MGAAGLGSDSALPDRLTAEESSWTGKGLLSYLMRDEAELGRESSLPEWLTAEESSWTGEGLCSADSLKTCYKDK